MSVRITAAAIVGGAAALTAALIPIGVASADTSSAPAAEQGAPGAERAVDSVQGKGDLGFATFEFNGRNASAERGSDPSGSFEADPPAAHFEGPITCLEVDGNRAGFIYPLDENTTPDAIEGQAVLILLEDGGPGPDNDSIGFVGPAPIAEMTDCSPGPTFLPLQSGDVTVTDAQ